MVSAGAKPNDKTQTSVSVAPLDAQKTPIMAHQLSHSQIQSPTTTSTTSSSNITPSTTSDVRYEFVNGDEISSADNQETDRKHGRETEDLENEPKNLIEDIYNVERREDQPKKRLKKTDTDVKSKPQFDVSGNSGLGDYMKEGRESSQIATPVVDLTRESPINTTSNDDEIEVTGSVDLSGEIVCYGKIENAMIQAHKVPKPMKNNFFDDFSRDWPPIKLGTRHVPGKSNRIDVIDPHGQFFGAVDSRTAGAIVPLLDTPGADISITARIELRRRLPGEEVWQPCSTQYRAIINLLGPRKHAEMVGRHLSSANVWLSTPSFVSNGVKIFNPHANLRRIHPNYGPSSASRPRISATYEVQTAEEVNDAVMKMFDQLKSAEKIPEMEPSPLIRTPLLSHQKQALWFMMEKEKDRTYGRKEEDNNSLWRVVYDAAGNKRYREIISGITLSEEPAQTYGGLLADMMGLGKTLSILALILETLPQSRRWENQSPNPDLVRHNPGIRNVRTTLLVSPLSAVNNWIAQIKDHLKQKAISYYVFHGPSRTTNVDELCQYDLIITTYSTISSELRGRGSKRGNTPLLRMNMFRIVLDEAHVIREQSAQQSQAIFRLNGQRRWSVTGTPVQNRLDDLASVTKFLRLYPYDDKSKFSAHILSRFKLGDPTVFASLRVLVDSFTLRRVKDKINLPSRHDKIIMLDFSEKEAHLHEFFRKESDLMMKVIANETKSTMSGRMYHHVLKAMMLLRQISAHGKELLDKEDRERMKGMSVHEAIDLEEGENQHQAWAVDKKAYEMFTLMEETSAAECAVCSKSLVDNNPETGVGDPKAPMAVMFPCFDVICLDCFRPIKEGYAMQPAPYTEQTKCIKCDGWIPMSYSAITPAGLEQYTNSQAEAKTNRKRAKLLGEYEGPHTKTLALLEHLQSAAEESAQLENEPPIKSVVFSAWTSHLDLIEIALKDHGLDGFTRLDGTMTLAARNQALNSFATDDNITILLATIGAGGVGLNLTSASRVYIMEPQYNPAAVAQAVDRVHRLGQKREVTTVQFIMKASIEEKIFEMAKKKQQLAEDSMARGKLDKREVQEARMQAYRSLFR